METNELKSYSFYIFKVQGTLSDPVPGYIDTIIGFLGACLGAATGAFRVIYMAHPNNCLNVIPADCVINSVLAVARVNSDAKQKIFNCVSKDLVIISLGNSIDLMLKIFTQ